MTEYKMQYVSKDRPICGYCGSGNAYVRTDDTIRCRRCGKITIPDTTIPKSKEEKIELIPKEDVK